MMEDVFVGLGSNLKDRRRNLKKARESLAREYTVVATSSVLETEPVGVKTELMFLNQVLRLRVPPDTTPEDCLEHLLQIERDMGRDRSRSPDRLIDLDLLYWEELVREDDPVVPHPGAHSRRFVLEPMVEIAPDFIHPVLKMSQRELLESLNKEQR